MKELYLHLIDLGIMQLFVKLLKYNLKRAEMRKFKKVFIFISPTLQPLRYFFQIFLNVYKTKLRI